MNPTFESLMGGETWDFPADAEVFGRAAINFRNSWFGSQLDPVGSVVDEDLDDRKEKVLAVMRAFAEQQERRREERRGEDHEMFAENLPRANHEAEHAQPDVDMQDPDVDMAPDMDLQAAPPRGGDVRRPAPPRGVQWGAGADGPNEGFLERMEQRRRAHPMEANPFNHRQQIVRDRERQRRNADRNKDIHHRRQEEARRRNEARAQHFDMSPPGSPRDPLGPKYEKRAAAAVVKRRPKVPKPQMAPTPAQRKDARVDRLQEKRTGAAQEARKRPQPIATRGVRKRLKTTYGAATASAPSAPSAPRARADRLPRRRRNDSPTVGRQVPQATQAMAGVRMA